MENKKIKKKRKKKKKGGGKKKKKKKKTKKKKKKKREIFMARPPKPPAYLDELAAQQWKAKAKQLAERGDLTPADWNNLELFCVNYSMYRKAVEDLASRGFSIVNSQGGERAEIRH